MEKIEWTNLFINLILTAFIYLLLPIILKIAFKNKNYDNKEAKEVAIINGVFVYIVLSVFLIIRDSTIASIAPALFWSFIAYTILKKKEEKNTLYEDNQVKELVTLLEKEAETPNIKEVTNTTDIIKVQNETKINMTYCTECGNKLLENHKFCWKCGNKKIYNFK